MRPDEPRVPKPKKRGCGFWWAATVGPGAYCLIYGNKCYADCHGNTGCKIGVLARALYARQQEDEDANR